MFRKIKRLEEDVRFWQQQCENFQKDADGWAKHCDKLTIKIAQLEQKIRDLENVQAENEIMRKYYKLDEEPSAEVQAKVLADLRLHDMEYKQIQEKLNSLAFLESQRYYMPVWYTLPGWRI